MFAHLTINSFLGDAKVSLQDFNATNLSAILGILHFSSNHLKTLELELVDREHNTAIKIIHTTNLIKSLESFQVLRKVMIGSDPGISLDSGSIEESKSLKVEPFGFDYVGELTEFHNGRSTYQGLIEQVTKFTGKGIERIHLRGLPEMSSVAFEALKKQSTESLESADIFLQGIDASTEEIISFLVTCPNLRDLLVSSDRSQDEAGLEVLEFRIPYVTSSKLRCLTIDFADGKSRIVLDEAFFSWAKGDESLDTFEIKGNYEVQKVPCPVDSSLLRSFLKIHRRTLVTLAISGIHSSYQTVSEKALKFPILKILHIKGNIEMVEDFSRCKFTCLATLLVEVLGENKVSADTHQRIIKMIRRCKKTLSYILIKAPQIQEKNQIPESEVKKPAERPVFSLSNVVYLNLDIDDEAISEFYLSLRYPKLNDSWSTLYLAQGSKLSKASFNQTRASLSASNGIGEVGTENPQMSS